MGGDQKKKCDKCHTFFLFSTLTGSLISLFSLVISVDLIILIINILDNWSSLSVGEEGIIYEIRDYL